MATFTYNAPRPGAVFGRCADCGRPIKDGQSVTTARTTHGFTHHHTACTVPVPNPDAAQELLASIAKETR